MKKKVWLKPKLVVLYRGRSDESVLQLCKNTITTAGDPAVNDTYCTGDNPVCNKDCLTVSPT